MSDTIEFTPAEFADYWESHQEDVELGERFMREQLRTEEGRELLRQTADMLATRHTLKGKKFLTFRTAMQNAGKRDPEGDGSVWTPAKVKGTGTKKHPEIEIEVRPVRTHSNPRPVDYQKKLYRAIDTAVCDGGWDFDEVREAVERILQSY